MYRSLFFTTLIALFSAAFRPAFDTITGTWKRTAMTLVESSGKSTDMNKMMETNMPCTKEMTYTFGNDGTMKTNVPDACGALKKTIESMNASGKWTMSGRKVVVTTTMKDIPPSTYDVAISGNTMTWTFNYADNPKMPNPTKAQRMTIVYQRI
ncbi:lipocalin-like domain-containing protein [Spirosoma aerolatum]|uniref:lipocalin family protein n=1 Tax=Spirosoma aerolatum TaxID=1211326 RepID=UPI0009AD9576|nr:lipocalin family protein [Spirosoma aerolatum]